MSELTRLRVLTRPIARRRYLASTPAPKLHLGCGPRVEPGWLNADKFHRRADIYLNAYRPLPFADGTFAIVFAEHLIEHLRIDKVRGFLGEVHRVLRPGGLFRVSCPDLGLFVAKYAAGDRAFFAPILEHFEGKRAKTNDARYWVVRTLGGALMSRAYFHHHRWMYDFATLRGCLEEVGFPRIVQQAYRRSVAAEAAALDNPDRAFESLYVDAVK
jgi:predicted SAM-dependent methyltransferase